MRLDSAASDSNMGSTDGELAFGNSCQYLVLPTARDLTSKSGTQ